MNKELLKYYKCPLTKKTLNLSDKASISGNKIVSGKLVCGAKQEFSIEDEIPNFIWPFKLREGERKSLNDYEEIAAEYDKVASFPFDTFGYNEGETRAYLIDKLKIAEGATVLELGCGTGRGSEKLLKKVGSTGKLFMQDISLGMLGAARTKFNNQEHPNVFFSLANGVFLPFSDNQFDAAFHFGGLNVFDDIDASLKELARVVKPGGKIVVGDESIAPWLRETEYAKIIMNANPMYDFQFDLSILPKNIENTSIEWIMGGTFYIIEIEVSANEAPKGNFDIPITGKRGGTMNKRYFGKLEGISYQLKKELFKAAEKGGQSRVDFIEELIKEKLKSEN